MRAVDRFSSRVQHAGHFARVEPEDIAQDKHGELARRQDLKGGDEGQRDGFGLLVAGLRAERHVNGAALEKGIGIWLEPDDLAEPGRLGRFNIGQAPLLVGRASAGRATRVETPVGGDPVQPGTQRGASLEPFEALPGGQQRVLQGVLGVLEGPEHPVAVHVKLSTVRLGHLPERVTVPDPRPRHQVRCHHSHVTFFPDLVVLPSWIDAGRGLNWAAARRPVCCCQGA